MSWSPCTIELRGASERTFTYLLKECLCPATATKGRTVLRVEKVLASASLGGPVDWSTLSIDLLSYLRLIYHFAIPSIDLLCHTFDWSTFLSYPRLIYFAIPSIDLLFCHTLDWSTCHTLSWSTQYDFDFLLCHTFDWSTGHTFDWSTTEVSTIFCKVVWSKWLLSSHPLIERLLNPSWPKLARAST